MNDTEILKHNNKVYTELLKDISQYTKLSEEELLNRFNPHNFTSYIADIKKILSIFICFEMQYKNYTA